MIWLFVIGLGAWLLVQQVGLRDLRSEVSRLRQRLATLTQGALPQPAVQIAPRAAENAGIAAAPISAAPPPRPLETDIPLVLTTLADAQVKAAIPKPAPAPPPAAPVRAITRAAIERWLAEKGLAWIGGSALVVGGAFLVGYAAQQGLFTPPLRIAAAALLGFLLLGTAELVRRERLAGFGGHELAASILTGAGAAVLYGTTWAAFDLYHFISGPECGVLLASVAAGLLGLAFVHGEALAALALGGAFVAPLVSGATSWTFEALTLYLGGLIFTGAAISWLRGWAATGWTNLAAATLWALLAATEDQTLKCLALGLGPLAALTLFVYLRPRAQPHAAFGLACAAAAALTTALALALAYAAGRASPEGEIAAVALPLLVAALQLRGGAPEHSLAAPAFAFAVAAWAARVGGHQTAYLTDVQCLQIVLLDLAVLVAATPRAAIGSGWVAAVGSLAVALAAGFGLAEGTQAAIAPIVACATLTLGAAWLASRRRRPVERAVLEIWGGSAAAALLLATATGLAAPWTALGMGAAALALALAARRLEWRSLAVAAAAGAGFGLTALLAPATLLPALDQGFAAERYLAIACAIAAASFAAARLLPRGAGGAEALRTISPLASLVGGFVFLRSLAGPSGGLDPLTEASIRTFLIATAGLVTLAGRPGEGLLAKWRGHALLGAAALHALFFQGLLYNPRLGLFADVVSGPPLLDSLTVAFAVPAALFAVAAARHYRAARAAGRSYAAVALLSALTWVALEIRRLTHGPHLAGGLDSIGPAEAIWAGLVLLAVALLIERLRTPPDGEQHLLRQDLGHIAGPVRWIAVSFALLVCGICTNPCWADFRDVAEGAPMAGVLAGYGMAAALIGGLAHRVAHRGGTSREVELLSDAAIAMALMVAGLSLRMAFHGGQLSVGLGAGEFEGWCYSALGASFGLGLVGFSRRGGRLFLRAGLALLLAAAAKVFVFDTANLSGVVRAGSFIALGALLLLGALTARRLAQPATADARARSGESPSPG